MRQKTTPLAQLSDSLDRNLESTLLKFEARKFWFLYDMVGSKQEKLGCSESDQSSMRQKITPLARLSDSLDRNLGTLLKF